MKVKCVSNIGAIFGYAAGESEYVTPGKIYGVERVDTGDNGEIAYVALLDDDGDMIYTRVNVDGVHGRFELVEE